MPNERECDYCGDDIEPGTGMMLVRKNGQTVDYCSAKCEKNADLGREARDLNWTDAGRESDRQETTAAAREAAADEADAEEADAEEADADTEDDSGATPDLEAAEAEADAEEADDASEEDDEQAEEAQA